MGALINLCSTEESKAIAVREGAMGLIAKLLKTFPEIYGKKDACRDSIGDSIVPL
jgi:hypothetical protein